MVSRTEGAAKSKLQDSWAAGHLKTGLGQLTLDKLDRNDIARWLETSAAAGKLSKRSLQICRMVLRAALADAVEEGLLRRSPATRVALPKLVVRVAAPKEVDAWDDTQVRAFLSAVADHRWGGPLRLAVLYGLRRSELLALRWSGIDLEAGMVTIAGGLVEVRGDAGLDRWQERSIPAHDRRRCGDGSCTPVASGFAASGAIAGWFGMGGH